MPPSGRSISNELSGPESTGPPLFAVSTVEGRPKLLGHLFTRYYWCSHGFPAVCLAYLPIPPRGGSTGGHRCFKVMRPVRQVASYPRPASIGQARSPIVSNSRVRSALDLSGGCSCEGIRL